VGGAQRGAETARLVDGGIDWPKMVEAKVAVGGREDRLQRVVIHKQRNHLPKVQLVAVETKGGRDAQFLAVEDHWCPVNRTAGRVANERLIGIGIGLLVVRGGVEQDQPLAIGVAAFIKQIAVIARGGGGLEIEHYVLIQDVEVAVGAIG